MEDFRETAYLREFETSNQCELMFPLNIELENIGLLQEDVKALRQITDTVESLLQHTVNKINKLINEVKLNNSTNKQNDVEVKISLRDGITQKPVKANMVLKDLIKCNIKFIEFQIFDQNYDVIINAPLVKELKLPVVLYAHFVVQPKVYCLFTENNNCLYTWYKSKNKEDWTKIANTFKYKMTEDDIEHYLKLECIPCNSTLTGPPAEVISENPVEMMGNLPHCPFEDRHKFTKEKLADNKIRIVSYNVLSNRYTDCDDAFNYCPPKCLAIDYRKQLTSKELQGYHADIICLQEVDISVFSTYYKDFFRDENYMGFYHRKGNKISEGLACFFNKKRFKKIDDHQIIYSNDIRNKMYTHLWNFVKVNRELKECFMRQMTSLHVTILKLNTARRNHCLIIGNTHLFYHPDHELVRIVQINMAMIYLNYLYKRYSQNNSVKLILCGDFNSQPSSAVFEYITCSKLSKKHKLLEKTKNAPDLSHNFQLKSACGKPKYTNYTKDFKDCLDYIFIEDDKIKVKNVVPFPTEEELSKYVGLPNEVYPSDHLALVVDLEILE